MASNNTKLDSALSEELKVIGQRESTLEQQCRELAAELQELRRRRSLIRALLGSTDDGEGINADSRADSGDVFGRKPSSRANGRGVADIAHDILVARGSKPMHYEELADQVLQAGGVLGGVTPAQTLVARISRDPRFVRPEKRGWYASAEFFPKARSVGARSNQRSSTKHKKAR
jgi:hypothetical protein